MEVLFMNNQFNDETLNKLGIFELRNLAREIGVYSPTIYKKKEIMLNNGRNNILNCALFLILLFNFHLIIIISLFLSFFS